MDCGVLSDAPALSIPGAAGGQRLFLSGLQRPGRVLSAVHRRGYLLRRTGARPAPSVGADKAGSGRGGPSRRKAAGEAPPPSGAGGHPAAELRHSGPIQILERLAGLLQPPGAASGALAPVPAAGAAAAPRHLLLHLSDRRLPHRRLPGQGGARAQLFKVRPVCRLVSPDDSGAHQPLCRITAPADSGQRVFRRQPEIRHSADAVGNAEKGVHR